MTDQVRGRANNGVVRATLLFLAAFLLAPLGFGQALQPGGPADFGTLTVGATPRTVSLTFSASVTTVISSVQATTGGINNKDFTIVFQTCTGVQSPPQSCTITVGFSPTTAGLRKGALSITDSTGTVVNRIFLHGVGLGPQLTFSPAPATVRTSLTPFTPAGYSPSGAAIDGSGNVYFNDAQFDRILKQDSTGTLSVVDLLFSSANSGVAIDGAGTLYIAAGAVVYSLVPGSVAKPLVLNNGVTLTNATGVAVDGSGFIYISDTGQNHIVRVGQDGTTGVLALTGLSTPLSGPAGLTVDANNLLYIADANNNRIVSAGLFTLASTVVPTGSLTLSVPLGVAVDPSGALSVTDTANKRIVEVPPSGAAYVLATPGVAFDDAVNISVKDNGDLVVADAHLGLVTLVRSASAVTFPTSTGVGHLDATDGALPFTVMNSGNVPLQLTVPTTGANPLISNTAFATTAASSCPLVTSTSTADASTQLGVGVVCNYNVSFTPQTIGVNSGTATLTATPVGGGTPLAPVVTLTGTGIPNITQFSVVATPSQTQPGVAVSLTVSALDGNGVVDPTYLGTATFTSTDPAVKFLAGTTYTFTAADNGTHTFSAPSLGVQFNTLGTYTVTATDGTITGTSNPVQVVQANGFTLVASPSTIALNGTVALTVTATFNGVPATGFTGTLIFTATDPAAHFLSGTTYTFQPADNGTHTFTAPAGVQFNSVGVFTISATDGLFTGTSNLVTVEAANSFTIVASPSTVLKDASARYVVTALYNGTTATNFTGAVTFTTTDPTAAFATTGTNTFTYTFTPADNGVHTFSLVNGVQFNTPGVYNISAASGSITGTSNAIRVVAADSFTVVASPTKLFTGQSAGYTVTAMYQGNVVTNYTGTVTFTTGDAAASFLSGTTYTFTTADNGSHTFTTVQGVQYNTPGTYTIGVTDGVSSGVSNQVVVIGADAITITATPTTIFVGQSVGYTVTVTAQGATVTNFTGTVTFTTGDAAAKFLSGTSYTFTAADNGTHTFTAPQGVQYNTGGTYTITATSGALTAQSNQIKVVAADGFTITATPTKIFAGQSVGYTVTATAQGAVVTSYTGTVTFTTGDPTAKFLSGTTYTFTAADNGVHTFTAPQGVQLNTGGTYTITVTAGAVSATSNPVQVVAVDGFTIVAAPTKIFAGQSVGYTVTATAQGTPVTSYTGTVTFTTGDPAASFLSGATYTFTAADNGVHTFTAPQGVQYSTPGTYTITATSGAATGTSNQVQVVGVDGFTIVASPANLLTGQSAGFTITATAQGATVTNFTGTVTFATGDPAAKFSSGTSYTFASADNGVHTFTVPQGVQYNTAGVYTITAAYGAVKGTSNQITVLGLDGFSIVAAPANLLLGQSAGFTITAMYKGAVATNFTGTVTFNTTDPKAVFLGPSNTYTFIAADNGTHTFLPANGFQFNSLGTFTINASDGTIAGVSNNIVVTNPTGIALTASANPILIGTSISLTASVTGSTGTPDGTATFFDNGTPLGTATLIAGVATLPNVTFTQLGLHPLTATYSGSTGFTGSQSAAYTEVVEDFSIAVAPGTLNSGSALVGHTATYTLLVSPVGGPTFAAPVTFTLSQELKGAKVVFTPVSLAAGASATNVTLAITPTQLIGLLHESMPPSSPAKKLAPVAFALLLLPVMALRRRKRFTKLLLLVVSLLPLTLMTGCLSSATDGYYGQAPQTVTLTVTGTSGSLTHSTQITISVQ